MTPTAAPVPVPLVCFPPHALSCWNIGLRSSKGYMTSGMLAKLPAVGLSYRNAQMRVRAGIDIAPTSPTAALRTTSSPQTTTIPWPLTLPKGHSSCANECENTL
ncbi:hypothetical protein E2C01_091354 [Portunus trituberculatus]|uniref:Uncharacterized protein n=1 Tax=Portunus trituberculatus TaxID=210409 RepID=A0A5B7JUS9_PORTR|nr:hypothetical protein [Portunus trituberculatus]